MDWTASAQPPPVVLYRSDEQLRGVACVNQSAIGYYDGAIHVSVDPAHLASHLTETVIHEYLHHVLNALGVRQPMWLHEGLAMLAAAERWFADPRLRLASWLRESHLPFEALVTAFPHTADEAFAVATYYQSYRMVQFLRQRRGADIFRGLTRELAAGALAPEGAFLQASGLPPGDLEAAFAAFLRSTS